MKLRLNVFVGAAAVLLPVFSVNAAEKICSPGNPRVCVENNDAEFNTVTIARCLPTGTCVSQNVPVPEPGTELTPDVTYECDESEPICGALP